MIEEKSLKEFRESGLLWFINTILHMFGWSIVMDFDGENNPISMYPARCKFRGFDEKNNDEGYQKVTRFLKENIDGLVEDLDA